MIIVPTSLGISEDQHQSFGETKTDMSCPDPPPGKDLLCSCEKCGQHRVPGTLSIPVSSHDNLPLGTKVQQFRPKEGHKYSMTSHQIG